MKKVILAMILGIFLMSFVSAIPQITITPNSTEIRESFDVSSEGYDWDEQFIDFNILEGYIDFPEDTAMSIILSDLLDIADFRIDVHDGDVYPKFTSFYLDCDTPFIKNFTSGSFSTTKILSISDLLLILDLAGYENLPACSDITAEMLNDLIQDNFPESPEPMVGDFYFEKVGTTYDMGYDADFGFGDIPEEYITEIEKVLEKSFYSFNYSNVPKLAFPQWFEDYLDEYNVKDYELSIDLGNLELVDETYPIIFELSNGDETYSARVDLTLEGMETEYDYEPEQEQIRNRVRVIKGLQLGNNVQIAFMDLSETDLPTNTKGLQLMNITLDYSQEAGIQFAIETGEVTNPDKVFLYVYENDAWTKLATTYLGESNGYYEYSAITPHFSLFLIGEEEEEEEDDDDNDGSPSSSDDDDEEDETIDSVCTEGATQCLGTNLGKCVNNEWIMETCSYGCGDWQCNNAPILVQDEEEDKGFVAGITGAIIGTLGTGGTIAISTLILGLIGAFVFVKIRKRRIN